MRLRTLSTLTLAGALALAACGDDGDSAAETTAAAATTEAVGTTEAPEPTDAPTTTARPTTTVAPATPATTATTATTATASTIPATSGYVPGADPDADAAALAWTTAFDSTTGYDAKAVVIADAEALRPTIEAYTPAGEVVGGITLEPTNVVITGDTAAITYKVLFAGTSPYPEQDGTVQRVDGVWVVARDQFCGFMAMARNPCT
jgi:iron complex transport system substrate-binding protein